MSLFSPVIQNRICFITRRLARVYRLDLEDEEELQQDAFLELLRALKKFNPAYGSKRAFSSGVLDKWYMHTARSIRQRRERLQMYRFSEFEGEPLDIVDLSPCHVRAADARMDLEASLSLLPRDLRWLAEELKYKSVREIAEDAGLHRGTVYRRFTRLRVLLREILDENE